MTIKTRMAVVGSVLTLVFMAGAGFAAEVSWTGGAGDLKWGTPGNWSNGQVPQRGDAVTLSTANISVVVDDDSAASFCSVASITCASDRQVTVNVTTNITFTGTMPKGASIRLATPIDFAVSNNAANNFLGHNYIDKGRFLMPNSVQASGNGYQFGRMYVKEGAALVARYATLHVFYGIFCDGMFTNSASTQASMRSSTDADAYIAGPIGGKWDINTSYNLKITGTNNVDFTGRMICPYNGARVGIAKFGTKYSAHSSIGSIQYLQPDYYGCIFEYLGEGETTDKNYIIAGSTSCEQELDAGQTGGLVWSGKFEYKNGYKNVMQRFVFSGRGTAKTNVLNCAWDALTDGCSTYVTKRGPSTWRFNSNAERKNAGVIAVEEGTLQFESLAERGTVCSLGTADILHERYSGALNPARAVDYAYLLGTVDKDGAVSSTGTMEFVGTRWGVATNRQFRLQGDGRLVATTADLSVNGLEALSAGEKRLTLSAAEGTFNTLTGLRDGAGKVSVVKDGPGAWTLGGAAISGSVEVRDGTLNVVSANAPYEYYRFTVMSTPSGELQSDYGYQVQLDELAFFDADGKRLNPSMSWKCDAHPTAGFASVSGDAHELAPNEMFFGNANGSPYFYAGNSYGMNYMCDNAAASGMARCYICFQTQNKTLGPQLDKPNTYVSVVLRLPAGAAGRAVKYDLLSSYADGNGAIPSAFKLEGSPDGRVWTVLDCQLDHPGPTTKNSWYSDETAFNASVAPTGFPIATHTAGAASIAADGKVGVSAGATLAAKGDMDPLDELVVKATGMGQIKGFQLAASGALAFEDVDTTQREIVIPADFSELADWAKLAGWSFTVNDKENTKFALSVGPDGFRLCKKGLLILLK